mmetsp:Transcript_23608/g.34945  ORF Transcript_23608/g.34945 Transcript_23608/m.34945 type:complete len:134 (-) Transcript_23608:253-654(-)
MNSSRGQIEQGCEKIKYGKWDGCDLVDSQFHSPFETSSGQMLETTVKVSFTAIVAFMFEMKVARVGVVNKKVLMVAMVHFEHSLTKGGVSAMRRLGLNACFRKVTCPLVRVAFVWERRTVLQHRFLTFFVSGS